MEITGCCLRRGSEEREKRGGQPGVREGGREIQRVEVEEEEEERKKVFAARVYGYNAAIVPRAA